MKNKTAFSLFLILFMGSTALSQSYVFPVKQKGSKKWGYASLDGNVIIEPRFSEGSGFTEQGYALVLSKRSFSIINIRGEVIETEVDKVRPFMDPAPPIASKYYSIWNYVHTFSDGYLVVSQNKKWGCLGPNGNTKIPAKYNRLTDFYGDYALAELNKKFFVVNIEGNEIPVDMHGIKEIKHFSEGLGIIEVKGEKWGFVDSNGKAAIIPQYLGVGYFSAGLAWAKSDNEKIGYINKKGEWIINPQFDVANAFDLESGLAMVKVDNKWGYVDRKGNISFFEETTKTFSFSEGLAIGRKNGKIGFLNNKGQWSIQPQFDVAYGFRNGYAAVESKNLWGIIDKEGNWVVQPAFSAIGDVAIIK